MHLLKIRCQVKGHFFFVRRPNKSLLIAKVLPLLICPICYPDQSEEVCGGCRLPFAIVGRHSKHLCETCFIQDWRYERKLIVKHEADSSFASTQGEVMSEGSSSPDLTV